MCARIRILPLLTRWPAVLDGTHSFLGILKHRFSTPAHGFGCYVRLTVIVRFALFGKECSPPCFRQLRWIALLLVAEVYVCPLPTPVPRLPQASTILKNSGIPHWKSVETVAGAPLS